MKILHISNALNYSGGVAQMIFLSNGLAAKGYDTAVICHPDSELAKRASVTKIFIDMNSQIPASFAIAKIISKEKPDIVHCHHPKAHNIVLMASFLIKIPNIVASRRVSFPIPKHPASLFKYRTKRNKCIVAVSSKIKSFLVAAGVKPARIRVIYSGTDCSVFNPSISGRKIKQEFKIPENALVIGKIANYSDWKGYGYFLDACKIISLKQNNIYFFIAGSETDSTELKGEVNRRGIEQLTKIAGFRDDMPDVIAALDISVNASVSGEGISGAMRESLAMEKPVVATDVGGNSELIKSRINGILVEHSDSEALAGALLNLIKNPEEARRMGKSGRETVLEKFSVDTMVTEHIKLYKELVNV